jgi:hypothetical protein
LDVADAGADGVEEVLVEKIGFVAGLGLGGGQALRVFFLEEGELAEGDDDVAFGELEGDLGVGEAAC